MSDALTPDVVAAENATCRQIVKEISLFGVSERQRMMIIYLLALELENVELLQEITATINDTVGGDLFLTARVKDGVDKNG